jgi:hypothetical protein
MRTARLLTLVAAIVLAAPATAAVADPLMFQTPSRNIACVTSGNILRCDMRVLGNAPRPKPKSCHFDYGHAFFVTKTGRRGRGMCVSDAVGGPGTPTVRYGTTWRRNGFQCRVRRTGLRCVNPRNHGFELRRGRQTLF